MVMTRSMTKKMNEDAQLLQDCLLGEHDYTERECHEDCPYNSDKWIECEECGYDHHPDYCEEDCEEEYCEEHEQVMWKSGLKCGGCLADEEVDTD